MKHGYSSKYYYHYSKFKMLFMLKKVTNLVLILKTIIGFQLNSIYLILIYKSFYNVPKKMF